MTEAGSKLRTNWKRNANLIPGRLKKKLVKQIRVGQNSPSGRKRTGARVK